MATKNRSISSEKILKICILAEMDKANVKDVQAMQRGCDGQILLQNKI